MYLSLHTYPSSRLGDNKNKKTLLYLNYVTNNTQRHQMNFIYPFTNNTSNLVLSTKVNKNLYDLIDLDKFKRAYFIKYKPNSLVVMTRTDYTDEKKLLNINSYVQYNANYT